MDDGEEDSGDQEVDFEDKASDDEGLGSQNDDSSSDDALDDDEESKEDKDDDDHENQGAGEVSESAKLTKLANKKRFSVSQMAANMEAQSEQGVDKSQDDSSDDSESETSLFGDKDDDDHDGGRGNGMGQNFIGQKRTFNQFKGSESGSDFGGAGPMKKSR